MSVKASRIFECIETAAPRSLAEEWDNVGLSVGSYTQEVHRVLTALDVSQAVVEEAISLKADLILSHHPFIFKGLKRICFDDHTGKLIRQLIQHNISVYSAHTNLDMADQGLNQTIAEMIGLQELKPLAPEGIPGRLGRFQEAYSPEAFIQLIKETLELSHLRSAGPVPEQIKRVALCTGAGAEYMGLAKSKGAHVFLTGDLKYHDAQRGNELGLWVIDAGHFGTEKISGNIIKKILRNTFSEDDLEIFVSKTSEDYLTFI